MGSVPFRGGDIKGYSDSSAFKREGAGQNKKAPFPDRLPGRRKRKLIFRGTIPVGVFEKRPLVGIGIKANAFPCNGRNPSTPTGEALFGRLLRGQKSCVCCCRAPSGSSLKTGGQDVIPVTAFACISLLYQLLRFCQENFWRFFGRRGGGLFGLYVPPKGRFTPGKGRGRCG